MCYKFSKATCYRPLWNLEAIERDTSIVAPMVGLRVGGGLGIWCQNALLGFLQNGLVWYQHPIVTFFVKLFFQDSCLECITSIHESLGLIAIAPIFSTLKYIVIKFKKCNFRESRIPMQLPIRYNKSFNNSIKGTIFKPLFGSILVLLLCEYLKNNLNNVHSFSQ